MSLSNRVYRPCTTTFLYSLRSKVIHNLYNTYKVKYTKNFYANRNKSFTNLNGMV